MRAVCAFVAIAIFCMPASVHAQRTLHLGSVTYTVGRTSLEQNMYENNIRWTLYGDQGFYSTATLPDRQPTTPNFARGGMTMSPFSISYNSVAARGNVANGGTGFINMHFASEGSPDSTRMTFNVAEHTLPKFRLDMNAATLIDVPFTMQGFIGVFVFYTPTSNLYWGTPVSGSGTATLSYSRTSPLVKAFRAAPNPEVYLDSATFNFAAPTASE